MIRNEGKFEEIALLTFDKVDCIPEEAEPNTPLDDARLGLEEEAGKSSLLVKFREIL